MSVFLASVERRAFKQAVFSVQDEDAALDIVQDTMLRLAEHPNITIVQEEPTDYAKLREFTERAAPIWKEAA